MKSVASFVLLYFIIGVAAKAQPESRFDKAEAFRPLICPAYAQTRSADGRPGEAYWQNQADYRIDATLDTVQNRLTGTVNITYTNNSPQPLDFVWMQLDQNAHQKGSRYQLATAVHNDYTNGFEISGVQLLTGGKLIPANYIIEDSRMQIRLMEPVGAKGGKLRIQLSYSFIIPENGGGRMGITETAQGKIYEIAQWYPRMAVYDDVSGWNTVPYQMGVEFYLPYGDISYNITAPAGMLLAGSGKLLNEKDVLTREERRRLEQAKNADTTVLIREPGHYTKPGMQRWSFTCTATRDVAWTASAAFIWDAACIRLPNNRKALAMSVYPKESAAQNAWKRSTAFIKKVIEFNSQKWYPYPWPLAINVAGRVGGMEYPGIVFCDMTLTDAALWEVTNHEFGHTIFPMIVGSNERKYAWMDEGFNTFINGITTQYADKQGVYKIPSDSLAKWQINRVFGNSALCIMNTPMINSYNEIYLKPAMALKLLRNQVLGAERFDYAFKKYIEWWSFKHPTPWDFFKAIENAAGEELSWFWNGWFFNNWKLDQAISLVQPEAGKGARITIGNNEQMAMPVIVKIVDTNNAVVTVHLPAEIWQKGNAYTFWHASKHTIKEVVIDPNKLMPDVNRHNNYWQAN